MRNVFIVLYACLFFSACNHHQPKEPHIINLTYKQADIQKAFDTLYNGRLSATGINNGFIEQALALCHRTEGAKDTITQDVISSMYLNAFSNVYDCVTTTTFQFPDGTITAMGVFNLIPGDTIAPDHDFPITGGSKAYHNIYGTYTRKYSNGTYHVVLRYYRRDKNDTDSTAAL